jgi:hypothetical protein
LQPWQDAAARRKLGSVNRGGRKSAAEVACSMMRLLEVRASREVAFRPTQAKDQCTLSAKCLSGKMQID